MIHRSESAKSDRIEIHYSPLVVLAATGLFVLALGWIGFWVIAGLFGGHFLLLLVGSIALLVGMPMVLSFAPAIVHPWLHKGPVLTLDSQGVTDVRKKCSFIPWADIGLIKLGVGETASFLCFEFRRPDRQRQDLPRLGALGALLNRFRSTSDWNVTLRLLACRKREVLKAACRLHQQSIRQQVVERNKGKGTGWSGTL